MFFCELIMCLQWINYVFYSELIMCFTVNWLCVLQWINYVFYSELIMCFTVNWLCVYSELIMCFTVNWLCVLQATSVVPDLNTIKAIQKIAWASGSGSLHLVHSSNEDIHKAHEKVKMEVLCRMIWLWFFVLVFLFMFFIIVPCEVCLFKIECMYLKNYILTCLYANNYVSNSL